KTHNLPRSMVFTVSGPFGGDQMNSSHDKLNHWACHGVFCPKTLGKPKSECRNPKEIRNPKLELPAQNQENLPRFGIRVFHLTLRAIPHCFRRSPGKSHGALSPPHHGCSAYSLLAADASPPF